MITRAAPSCNCDVRQLNSSYCDTLLLVFEKGGQEQITAQLQYAIKGGSHIRQSAKP